MTRFIAYLLAALFLCGILLHGFAGTAHAQKSKPRNFYIESQPGSPLLIRDLTATILPKNKYRNEPEIEVVFYIENTSKKQIRGFIYGGRAADGSDEVKSDEGEYNEGENFNWHSKLLPGELTRAKFTYPVEGVSIVYRIGSLTFEDNTEWDAKPFKAAKVKKSAPIVAAKQKFSAETKLKRILTREWTIPIFNDRVTKTLNGRPRVIDGIAVQTKIHEIEREDLGEVESCRVEIPESKRLSAADRALMSQGPPSENKVESFTTYEINGIIFAYIITYESVEAETGREIGVGFENIYVDEDGSGTFKLYCKERDLKTLPQWVKALAEK
jgi:hypothetical protein